MLTDAMQAGAAAIRADGEAIASMSGHTGTFVPVKQVTCEPVPVKLVKSVPVCPIRADGQAVASMSGHTGTHVTCFTGTKVQTLTPEATTVLVYTHAPQEAAGSSEKQKKSVSDVGGGGVTCGYRGTKSARPAALAGTGSGGGGGGSGSGEGKGKVRRTPPIISKSHTHPGAAASGVGAAAKKVGGRTSSEKSEVRSLLALLVQKYEYWQEVF